MDFPPFIDYTRFESSPGGIVEPRDSMDVRILKEAAREFNFSFVMREPEDGQWGWGVKKNIKSEDIIVLYDFNLKAINYLLKYPFQVLIG